jgi:TetR/AcrR family transcriptional regulator, lmrAB and yxaGH operons repressor
VPAAIATREEVLDKLLLTFRRFGYESASLALISEATGLGKASLYHHFPGGKRDMLIAVLETLEEKFHREVLSPLAADGNPARRIGAMLNYLQRYYRDGHEACLLGMLALEDERDFYQSRLKQLLTAWISALASPLCELGWSRGDAKCLAMRTVTRIQGSLIVTRGLGDYAPFKAEMVALRAELLATPASKK